MIIIWIEMKVLPDKKKEFLQTIESLSAHIKGEHGCLNVTLYQQVEGEHEFLLVEEWLTSEDSETHLQSDAFQVLRGTANLLSQAPEFTMYWVEQKEMAVF